MTFHSNDLLDEREAASYLKFNAKTLRNWRATKKGPEWVRVSTRSIRYRFSDLEAFIAASTAKVVS